MSSVATAARSANKTRSGLPVRAWATPLTIGAFLLMAATGVLMFFGVRVGLVSEAHEWFSWLFLAGAVAHLVVNWRPLTLHLKSRWGRMSIAAAAVILVVALLPVGIQSGHQMHRTIEESVVAAPLETLASLARVTPQDLETRFKAHGLAASAGQSARDIAAQNGVDERAVLAAAFANR